MRRGIIVFMLGFTGAAIALGGEPRADLNPGSIEIILDFKNHLALVPEGTILPKGFTIVGKYRTSKIPYRPPSADHRLRQDAVPGGGAVVESDPAHQVSFVFSYAPDEAFAPFRRSAQQHPRKVAPLFPTCSYTYSYYTWHPDCMTCDMTFYDTDTLDPCYFGVDYYTEWWTAEVTPANEISVATVGSSDG